jgi:nitrogen regulatory protein PII
MRMLLVITDSEALKEFERGLVESGDRGFTIAPRVYGRGRSGMHAGDRVHPGASSMIFTVVPDADFEATLGFLRRVRDQAGARESTKIYALPVEELD